MYLFLIFLILFITYFLVSKILLPYIKFRKYLKYGKGEFIPLLGVVLKTM